ncbi:MAG: hypothetical protein L3K24_03705 [Gammaproteobacteria bacterium]|nr:hypothetical protein [Gammaproteobacteria bacterium]
MSKSINEFKRFLSLKSSSMNEYELKLARIILDNFDAIEGKSSAGGARANILSKLIQKFGKTVDPYVDDKPLESEKNRKIVKLNKLRVKGFRGFSDEVTFDLSKNYVFMYGPNGSGKSSFCEALEYSLTGRIQEASTKRFDIDNYIKNNSSTLPSVYLSVEYDSGIERKANESTLENDFIFIERNRIESFARVSSFTPQAQQVRLSALFGLDQFNNFCNGFNKSIENRLPLNPTNFISLQGKEKEIQKYKLVIENKNSEIEGYEERKKKLLSRYSECKLVTDIVVFINDENDGILNKKKKEVQELSKIKLKSIEKIDGLSNKLNGLEGKFKTYKILEKEISQYRTEINFIDLYSAIVILSESQKLDKCPACDTPLERVISDPYVKASSQLSVLKEISKKQQEIIVLKSSISNDLIRFSAEVKSIEIDKEVSFSSFEEDIKILRFEISKTKDKWLIYNVDNKVFLSKKDDIEKEVKILEKDNVESSTLSELYKAAFKEKNSATKIIEKFNNENKILIKSVESEKKSISFYSQYAVSYEKLIEKLNTYSEYLPLNLSKSLESLVLEIYNSINKHPYDHELLVSLTLPVKPSQSIKIQYINGNPEDALRVLSEGHLRCLGLSILLAKNIFDEHNIIIFDDVVNAIDDEHRSGIIRELFTNEKLIKKQMVLTTHGEDFVKRLENELPKKELKKLLKRYDFIKNFENRDVLIEQDLNRHFLEKADKSLKKGFTKDCLMECRRSLEELTTRLWKKIGQEGLDSSISVKLRSPNIPPDLYNLIDGLIKNIGELEKKPGINNFTKHKDCLLKIKDSSKKNQVTWKLLNKGTHQEDMNEEFDENQAGELLTLCVELDGLVKSYRRQDYSVATVGS